MQKNPESRKPAISLPKGGGSIKGIGETFKPNLFTGTGNFSVPIYTSPCRNDFYPKLTLQYCTGNGNGLFGLGWQLSLPRITRKTEKGLPTYTDKDVFIMSGAEDLVPYIDDETDIDESTGMPVPKERGKYLVTRYRPRTEGLFARIEKWYHKDTKEIYWRVTTKENITSIYGKTENAKILKAESEKHVFEWLLEETFDAKGNHILYEYIKENPSPDINKVYENNRKYNNRYIRRILYGNTTDNLDDQKKTGPNRTATHHLKFDKTKERYYLFEVLFDYGDLPKEFDELYNFTKDFEDTIHNTWPVREDSFSSFRAGFEIRTLRRCERVLMLHHIPEGELVDAPLVKSTDFEYINENYSKISMLYAVKITGYRKKGNTYIRADMPPAIFKYSKFKPDEQKYQGIQFESDEFPPLALSNQDYSFFNINSNGLPDILNTTDYGYFIWSNLGNGTFDQRRPHNHTQGLPHVKLSDSHVAVGDLAGDGLPDIIVSDPVMPGFYEALPEGEWKPFKKFEVFPSLSLANPDLRLIDLTGDGLSDILVTQDNYFLWFQSIGEKGYDHPRFEPRINNLEQFPDVYFSDASRRVRLADMTGDGLLDIVLIHDGRIDYWPNMGYGKFGGRITMGNAPKIGWDFNPARLFLADIDGTGCNDVVYVDLDKVHVWFNQSGNCFSQELIIHGTPCVNDATAIQFVDLFSTGTASLVWSYDLHLQPNGNYKAIDFCGGKKPHLLVEMSNNMGATTKVKYASSTKFYLEDKKNNVKWITPLPFPVNVVEKTEVIDHISKTKLVTTYKYHHGYFDGREREFRGFGRVDEFDTEIFEDFTEQQLHHENVLFDNNNKCFHLPTTETRTWHHTGVYFDPDRSLSVDNPLDYHKLMEIYESEFYQDDVKAFQLKSFRFDDVSASDPHEVFRALHGSIIRSEVYAHDQTEKAEHPYSVKQSSYDVQVIQPSTENCHGIYFTAQKETLSYYYERNPEDPRIEHHINLKIDSFGNVTDGVTIGYPRRKPVNIADDRLEEQKQLSIAYTKTNFINKCDDEKTYFIGVPYQTKVFEITGMDFMLQPGKPLEISQFPETLLNGNEYQSYLWERPQNHQGIEKRMIDWKRYYFRKNQEPEKIDPIGDRHYCLRLGEIESFFLPYESYQAAFTQEMIETIYGNKRFVMIKDCLKDYYKEDAMWWLPSGKQSFSKDYFFQPIKTQDVFGYQYKLTLDSYGILLVQSEDPLKNKITAKNNYRVLQPDEVVDGNGVKSNAAYDSLGMMVGMAIKGKNAEGDSLDEFNFSLSSEQIQKYINDPYNQDQYSSAHYLLKQANTRYVYDLHRYKREAKPVAAASITRIKHTSDLVGSEKPVLQLQFVYSDGFGREIQSKVQAEPGKVDGQYSDKRWVGTGWKIYNNKGKPVQEFEPFPSNTHEYEANVKQGFSPVLFYDPLQRVVATLHAHYTYDKVVFSPWQQSSWDGNDTVLLDPRTDDDVKDYIKPYLDFREIEQDESLKTWFELRTIGNQQEKQAAEQTKKHQNTPFIAHMDHFGRVVKTIADDGTDDKPKTKINFDIEGNELKIIDSRKIECFKQVYDLAGRKLSILSKDAGLKLVFPDAQEKSVLTWDGNGQTTFAAYDKLGRLKEHWVKTKAETDYRLITKIIYGENRPVNNQQDYFNAQVWKTYDTAGLVENKQYDFKGNLLKTTRKILKDGKAQVVWACTSWNHIKNFNFNESDSANLLDDNLSFTVESKYDALNRVQLNKTPDSTIHEPVYNEAGFLNELYISRENGTRKAFVKNIEYNAKGQRTSIIYGNDVRTTYGYDDKTYRLKFVKTVRENNSVLQDLLYFYDPVGNITHIKDNVHQTVFNHNDRIEPICHYIYDPLYRLIQASGREHNSMSAIHYQHNHIKHTEFISLTNQPINNGQDLGNYLQQFEYDKSGNLTLIKHKNITTNQGWERLQTYADDSNQILTSKSGNQFENSQIEHDGNGNIIILPYMKPKDINDKTFTWDERNQLIRAVLNRADSPDIAYYQYDAFGQRVRKTVVKQGKIEEHIYLGGYEIYTENIGNQTTFRRDTIHVMDDKDRIALIEVEKEPDTGTEKQIRVRYQLNNHLGSSCMEVDDSQTAKLISYEEYYAYGGTAYLAGTNQQEVKAKRYRYSGKERDGETGLYYYGARYYAPWMIRWMTPDPAGTVDGLNLYEFVKGNPVLLYDEDGNQTSQETTFNFEGDDLEFKYTRKTEYTDASKTKVKLPRCTGIDIDEQKAVGQKGVSVSKQYRRALNPYNRSFRDVPSNVAKGTKVEIGIKGTPPRSPISLLKDPTALFTRTFGEIKELKEISDKVVESLDAETIKSMKPTELKALVNRKIREFIKQSESQSAQIVRKAFQKIGWDPQTMTPLKSKQYLQQLYYIKLPRLLEGLRQVGKGVGYAFTIIGAWNVSNRVERQTGNPGAALWAFVLAIPAGAMDTAVAGALLLQGCTHPVDVFAQEGAGPIQLESGKFMVWASKRIDNKLRQIMR